MSTSLHTSSQQSISSQQSVDRLPLCDCAAQADGTARQTRPWGEFGLLLALWLLHCAGNAWWLLVDTRPPFSDMAGHAATTLRISTWPWRQWVMEGSIFHALLNVTPYPPLFYVSTLPLVWFVSPAVDAMLVVNLLYMGLLIASTYGIGRLAVGGRVGLLAAFLVSMYPIIYGLSRHYLADVALTAVVCFAVFCLFWSRAFDRRWPSIILGLGIGAGVLTKWTSIVFLAGPLAIAVWMALREGSRTRLINMVLAGAISIAIGLPWYVNNLEDLYAFLEFNRLLAAPREGEAPIWTLASWSYYLDKVLTQQLLLPFTLLFVAGAVLALRRCRLNGYLAMLLSWIVAGYVISTLFINKDTRYTMPYLPALALVTAIGLSQIRQIIVRRVGLALIVIYALLQYASMTIGWPDSIARLAGTSSHIGWTVEEVPFTFFIESVHIAAPPQSENWQIEPIFDAVLADAGPRTLDDPISLLVVPAMIPFEPQAFIYVRWRDRLPVDVLLVTGILEVESAAMLQRSEYVVTKSGDLGWEFVLQEAGTLTAQLLDPNSTLAADFEPIAEFPLPDGSTAFLFRHLHKEQ